MDEQLGARTAALVRLLGTNDDGTLRLPAQASSANEPIRLPVMVQCTLDCSQRQSSAEIKEKVQVACIILAMEQSALTSRSGRKRGRVFSCCFSGAKGASEANVAIDGSLVPFTHLNALSTYLYGQSTGSWNKFVMTFERDLSNSPYHACRLGDARVSQEGPGFVNTLPDAIVSEWMAMSTSRKKQKK